MKPIIDPHLIEKTKKTMEVVEPLVDEIANDVLDESGGLYLPGFNIRVKAYALDALYTEFGVRTQEHRTAVDVAFYDWKKNNSPKHIKG